MVNLVKQQCCLTIGVFCLFEHNQTKILIYSFWRLLEMNIIEKEARLKAKPKNKVHDLRASWNFFLIGIARTVSLSVLRSVYTVCFELVKQTLYSFIRCEWWWSISWLLMQIACLHSCNYNHYCYRREKKSCWNYIWLITFPAGKLSLSVSVCEDANNIRRNAHHNSKAICVFE